MINAMSAAVVPPILGTDEREVSVVELHRRAMCISVETVDLIRDDQWDLPTPCSQWTLRELVAHMTAENLGFAGAADGETEDRAAWTFTPREKDLRSDYARSAERVVSAFGADGVLDREFWLPRINDAVTFPAHQAISYHLLDYLIHNWDVAASLGRPITFGDDLVDAVTAIADRYVPDGPRRHRPGAGFGPPEKTAADATKQDRMLAFLGRSPTWPS